VAKRILLADKDEAFGTMMAEALRDAGDFEVQLAQSAAAALTLLRQTPHDLLILDMGVDDVPPGHTVRGARLLRPNIAVLVIPLDGDEVPRELGGLGVQGVLHKIFFRLDLGERLAAALGLPGAPGARALPAAVTAPAPAPAGAMATPVTATPAAPAARQPARGAATVAPPAAPAPAAPAPAAPAPAAGTPAAPRAVPEPAVPEPAVPELELGYRASEEIDYHLRLLANETNADAVLFTYGGRLVASAGMLPRGRSAELAAALGETWQAMHRLAVLSGDGDGISQALFEGRQHTIYSVVVATHGAITVAAQAGTSPGAIRLRAREAASAIEMIVT
jgi:CheY-like chemotaxis protein/predicted regulator of Ras-like GTPase activity (Roadblock/LC7/MglB family)